MVWSRCFLLLIFVVGSLSAGSARAEGYPWKVGTSSRELIAEDSMVIGGGTGPGYVSGQEGKLLASSLVIQGSTTLCIVAVDVLMIHRDHMDRAAKEIESRCGIPFENILINCSHTHHAPSTVTIHGYERDEAFCTRVVDAIVGSAVEAHQRASESQAVRGRFRLGVESTVGQNSRQLLRDGRIYWIGPRDEFVRPTDPFDSDLPVMAFEDEQGKTVAAWFNHSTHCIGTRTGKRSPGFYGLAAQELTEQHKAPFLFLSGAAGSTHNLVLDCDEMVTRLRTSVNDALVKATPIESSELRAIKRELTFSVRTFDEQSQDQAVVEYCKKYAPGHSDAIVDVFRDSRRKLKSQQGQERTMWLQAVRVGDVYLVAVPAEFFTALGLEIKRRSPYRYTFVCGLSNDYVGYTPNRKGFENGGYQTWMGLHSYSEVGTGEAIVEECLKLLEELDR